MPSRWPWIAAGAVCALTLGAAGGVVTEPTASDGGIALRRSDAAPPPSRVATTSTTTSTVAPPPPTTMPPRAAPVRLAPTAPGPLLGTVIVVDPGHNGGNAKHVDVRRPGPDGRPGQLCNTVGSATAGGLSEARINWEIGLRLTRLLRSIGAEVVLTHPDNQGFGPCADERGLIAREVGANALISIHADGSAAGSGFHVISPAPKPTLSPDTITASATLARATRDQLVLVGGRPANYVGRNGLLQRDDLANLNQADRPAILVELGNLKHPTDAAMLSDEVAWVSIARALARGLVEALDRDGSDARLSPDIGGDGWPNLLPGAPQLATTTTTSIAPNGTGPNGTDPNSTDPNGTGPTGGPVPDAPG